MSQPPTDTLPSTAPEPNGWRWLFAVLAALLGTVLVLTPSPAARKRD